MKKIDEPKDPDEPLEKKPQRQTIEERVAAIKTNPPESKGRRATTRQNVQTLPEEDLQTAILADLQAQKPTASQATLLLGVERDSRPESLPAGSAVLEIAFEGGVTAEGLKALPKIISESGGVYIKNPFSTGRELRYQYIFPNNTQAVYAATEIYSKISKAVKAGIGVGSGQVSTLEGRQLFLGKAFCDASESISEAEEGNLVIRNNGAVSTIKLSSKMRPPKEKKEFAKKLTMASIRHALNLKQLKPLTTSNAVLITITPAGLHHEVDSQRLHSITSTLAGEDSIVSTKGNCVQILVGGEGSPGQVARSLEWILEDIGRDRLSISLDFGKVGFRELSDGRIAFQSDMFGSLKIPQREGVAVTDRFLKASKHERNLAFAKIKYAEHDPSDPIDEIDRANGLTIVSDIETVLFEPSIGGSRKMVGRDAEMKDVKTNLDRLEKDGESSIEIFEGESGIGKTKLADEAIKEAKIRGIRSVYCKSLERSKNVPRSSIKNLIASILAQTPYHIKDQFTDLDIFSRDVTPNDDERQTIDTLTESKIALTERFKDLLESVTQEGCLQLIVDDLQWFDTLSREILNEWISGIKKNSKVNLKILGRIEEGLETPEDTLKSCKKNGRYSRTRLEKLKFTENRDQLSEMIRYALPEEWGQGKPNWEASLTVPESVLDELTSKKGDLPIFVKEIVEALIRDGKVSLVGNTVSFEEGAIKKMIRENPGATLTAIFQAKFSRLETYEAEVANHLVVFEGVSEDIFIALMMRMGHDEDTVVKTLRTLRQREIITFNPFGFAHDLLRQERSKQVNKTGKTAELAAKGFMALHGNRERHADIITPQLLFSLLSQARMGMSSLSGETKAYVAQVVTQFYARTGQQAVKYHKGRLDNERCLETTKELLAELSKELSVQVGGEQAEQNDAKIRELAQYLFEMYIVEATTLMNMGKERETTKVLADIQALAGLMDGKVKLLEGLNFLEYTLMTAKTVFRDKEALNEILVHLRVAISFCKVELAAKEESLNKNKEMAKVYLAEAEGGLLELRHCKKQEDREAQAEKVLKLVEKAETSAGKASDPDLDRTVKAVRLDVSRTKAYMDFWQFYLHKSDKLKGIFVDSIFLQRLSKEDQLLLQKVKTELVEVKTAYESDHRLIRDPQALGTIYDALARIEYLSSSNVEEAANSGTETKAGAPAVAAEEVSAVDAAAFVRGVIATLKQRVGAEKSHADEQEEVREEEATKLEKALSILAKGLLSARNMGLIGMGGRLRRLKAELEIAEAIDEDIGTPKVYDSELLKQAISDLGSAAYEYSRTYQGGKGELVTNTTMLKMLSIALYSLSELSKEKPDIGKVNALLQEITDIGLELNDEKRARELGKRGEVAVTPKNVRHVQSYLDDLSTLGLLIRAVKSNAGLDQSIVEKICERVNHQDLRVQIQYIAAVRAHMAETPGYAKRDEELIGLKEQGIEAILENIGGPDTNQAPSGSGLVLEDRE